MDNITLLSRMDHRGTTGYLRVNLLHPGGAQGPHGPIGYPGAPRGSQGPNGPTWSQEPRDPG